MSWLINLFGSKKLVAVVGGVLATLLVPILNAKLGLGLDAASVSVSIGAVLTAVLSYVAAQWHIDIKTNGATTTASVLLKKAAEVVADIAPDGTPLDAVAKAVAEALKDSSLKPEEKAAIAGSIVAKVAGIVGP
jgi:hypothetical protein